MSRVIGSIELDGNKVMEYTKAMHNYAIEHDLNIVEAVIGFRESARIFLEYIGASYDSTDVEREPTKS